MSSKNNFSPSKIAFIVSFILQLPFYIVILFLSQKNYYLIILIPIVGVISYYLTIFYFKKYIEEKIKLIFKIINATKATKRKSFFENELLPIKTLDEVQDEVTLWANNKNLELEKLEETSNYRKELLQNLSHELKTPIFAVQGFLDIIKNETGLTEDQKNKFWQNTENNLERLSTLINDLDKIGKLDSGELQLNKSKFVIQKVINEVFETVSILAKEKNIACTIKLGCESPLNVYADADKIKQVLTNLIENAIKYGKQNGTVVASIYKTTGKYILTEISDNGIGIAPEHHARLFERFYRTDFARDRKIGGSGLGLAICKHIIEAHGTSIHIRSAEDIGTTFGFILPQNI